MDFELTSEGSSNPGEGNLQGNHKEKLKQVTSGGNLRIANDQIWSYWHLLKSDDYFERLFLDIEQAHKITNEQVTNHYEEIKRYLDKWKEREGTGISFAESHGGYPVADLIKKLETAYENLRVKKSREKYVNIHKNEKKSEAVKSLVPIIKMALADKILTYDEKTLIYQEGIKSGLSIKEIDEEIEHLMQDLEYLEDHTSIYDRDFTNNTDIPKEESFYCKNCGSKNVKESIYCSECGNNLSSAEDVTQINEVRQESVPKESLTDVQNKKNQIQQPSKSNNSDESGCGVIWIIIIIIKIIVLIGYLSK